MYLGKTDVNTYDKGAGREFLVSNGQGSYGFSTVIGANTRREHGLLVTRPKGEPQHAVLVSKVEETIFAHNKKYQLSTNKYKDLTYPDGYRYIQEYQGTPTPKMLFVIHSIFLEKSIFMPQGGNCTVVKYKLLAAPEKITLEIRPLFAHRAKDYIPQPGSRPTFVTSLESNCVHVNGRGHSSYASFSVGKWSEKPLWYENLVYEQDIKKDSPELDFLWSPGYESVEMQEGDVLYAVFSEQPVSYTQEDLEKLEKETHKRLQSFLDNARVPVRYNVIQDLIHASYHLVDHRAGETPAIYSGYPSVSIKSRDAFISLPGLTLATGREKEAGGILDYWIDLSEKSGNVVPGLVDYTGAAVIDGADVGLWLFYALQKYVEHVKSFDKVRARWLTLKGIIHEYISGIASLQIETDESTKLLHISGSNSRRHWMSGNAEGEAIVTRKGFLVEINALWYNALCFMEQMASELNDTAAKEEFKSLSEKVKKSFVDVFVAEGKKQLFDWVDPKSSEKDETIRPNMILAASLPNSPLDEKLMKNVFAICWDELYTTYGLRTLSPGNDRFKGRAEGRADQKTKAKFRGMAWPWLLGQFITVYMRLSPNSSDMGLTFIRPFNSHARHGCLGGVAEFFDGIMPYAPCGDVLSAVSLGEVLRVLHEELLREGK